MSSKTKNFDEMGKSELRAACKAAGIPYGKLTVAGMRGALLKKAGIWDERNGPDDSKPKRAQAAPVVATAPKVEREVRNGVKRPRDGGLCAAVWAALDKMHAANIAPTTQQVRELAVGKGWSENNSLTELSQWRRFHGLSKACVMPKGKRKNAAKNALPATLVDASQPAA
jgi:hypothetical protein